MIIVWSYILLPFSDWKFTSTIYGDTHEIHINLFLPKIALTHNDSSKIKCQIKVWPLWWAWAHSVFGALDILKAIVKQREINRNPTKFNYLLIRLTWILFELIKYEPHADEYFFRISADLSLRRNKYLWILSRHCMCPINTNLLLLWNAVRLFIKTNSSIFHSSQRQVNIFNVEMENLLKILYKAETRRR